MPALYKYNGSDGAAAVGGLPGPIRRKPRSSWPLKFSANSELVIFQVTMGRWTRESQAYKLPFPSVLPDPWNVQRVSVDKIIFLLGSIKSGRVKLGWVRGRAPSPSLCDFRYSVWLSDSMDIRPVIFGVRLSLLVFSLHLLGMKLNFSVGPGSPDRNTTADTFLKLWSTKTWVRTYSYWHQGSRKHLPVGWPRLCRPKALGTWRFCLRRLKQILSWS